MKKGFTLLELLVVIAIIGILSSVVMVSLSNAKNKAKSAVFINYVSEFGKLMDIEYANANSYNGLGSNSWLQNQNDCNTHYGVASGKTSELRSNAYDLCVQIINSTSELLHPLYVMSSQNSYSVNGWMGSSNLLYCVGSSGKSFPSPSNSYNSPGCLFNP